MHSSPKGEETAPRDAGEYLLIGVGERFANADGSSRQDEIARCKSGERVHLVRERDNPRDAMAIALYSCRGVQLGYLNREQARWIAPVMDQGSATDANVASVAPKGRPFSPLALTIKLRLG